MIKPVCGTVKSKVECRKYKKLNFPVSGETTQEELILAPALKIKLGEKLQLGTLRERKLCHKPQSPKHVVKSQTVRSTNEQDTVMRPAFPDITTHSILDWKVEVGHEETELDTCGVSSLRLTPFRPTTKSSLVIRVLNKQLLC